MKNLRVLRFKKRLMIFLSLILLTIGIITAELNLRYPKDLYLYFGEKLYHNPALPYTAGVPAGGVGMLDSDGTIKRDTSLLDNEYNIELKLFGIIPVKTVNVNLLPEKNFVASGKTVGIKLFCEGLMCVGISEITDKNGRVYNLESLYGIKAGDILISANEIPLNATEELGSIVSKSEGNPITLTFKRGDKTFKKEVVPIETDDGFKLGIWVRDGAAGIGTLTFSDPDSLSFGALGHPITDADTGLIMPASGGEITDATVVGINKGLSGAPGELKGVFKNSSKPIGDIDKNTEKGIYGKLNETCSYLNGTEYPICTKNSITEGKAHILSNIDGETVETFEIEIKRVMRYNIDNFKDMVIEITDEKLLSQTGGIVQGMSGSPIIQNGKLVGAVTHVFVNDPTKGYGIFIENMLEESGKIK